MKISLGDGSSFFFFGSLRYRPLLEIVLGRACEGADISEDILEGVETRWAGGDPFPLIATAEHGSAAGIVVDNISTEERARLDYFEGSDEYVLREITLKSGRKARCYLPGSKLGAPGEIWDFENWRETWGDFSCHAAREYMSYFGTMPEADADAMWPAIQKRAWAKVRAGAQPASGETFQGRFDVSRHDVEHAHYFRLDRLHLSHERFDGTMSREIDRTVFVVMDAAFVLPYDPVRDRVLLLEQVRFGPLIRGDADRWQLEPIAGAIDPGETAQDACRREAIEEAGLTLGALHSVANGYPSPGGSTEFFTLFVGIADLPDGVEGEGGLESEGENIRSHLMPYDDLIARLDQQRLSNLPLILLANWLARRRDRLRAGA